MAALLRAVFHIEEIATHNAGVVDGFAAFVGPALRAAHAHVAGLVSLAGHVLDAMLRARTLLRHVPHLRKQTYTQRLPNSITLVVVLVRTAFRGLD